MTDDLLTADKVTFLQRSFFQRLLGRCVTTAPADSGCWSFADGALTIDLARVPELAENGTAVRIEGKPLPDRVLVARDDNGTLHAFQNRCGHGGRRVDPVPGAGTVQCCSIGRATYDYNGKLLYGPAKRNLTPYEVSERDGKLLIRMA